MQLLDLPEALLSEVASLVMADWPHLAASASTLRHIVGRLRAVCREADEQLLRLSTPMLPSMLDCVACSHLRNLPRLRELRLRALPITDKVLSKIAMYCPILQVLDFVGCRKITNTGMCYLIGLPHIQSLDITFCELVTYSSVVFLRNSCPQLREIRRQPAWLDGLFETPWGEVGHPTMSKPHHLASERALF